MGNCDTGSVTVVESLFCTSELTFSISYTRGISTLLSLLDMKKEKKHTARV